MGAFAWRTRATRRDLGGKHAQEEGRTRETQARNGRGRRGSVADTVGRKGLAGEVRPSQEIEAAGR